MFTISLFLIPVSVIILFITFSDCFKSTEQNNALLILGFNFGLIFLIVYITRWLRKKFVTTSIKSFKPSLGVKA